jgi:hypothetical protein
MESQGNSAKGFCIGSDTGPDGKPTGKIVCYPCDNGKCIVVTIPQPGNVNSGFLSLPEPTPFHDDILIKATQEINEILMKVARETTQDTRKTSLHLLSTNEGPMLLWADSMVMPVDDIRKFAASMKSW